MVRRNAMATLENDELLMQNVETLLDDSPAALQDEESVRKTKRRPHEQNRAHRQMSVTFPSAEWGIQVRRLAERWDLRPADVMVYAVSFMMSAIEAGELRRPGGEKQRFYHRSGEALELPWEPD